MDQRYVIDIQFEPTSAFEEELGSEAPTGGAIIHQKFLDTHSKESWLGKCDGAINEEMTKRDACREKLANDIYRYYKIFVPRLHISRQRIPQAIKDGYNIEIDYGYYVMSRWFDRFEIYGYLPEFKSGQTHHEIKLNIENQSRSLREYGLGHILAVAHWLNDIDVMNQSGKNVGYQLQLDTHGKLYAKSCKIDPGYAFWEFSEIATEKVTDEIRLSTHNTRVAFGKLPIHTQQEYLTTLEKIVATKDEEIVAFFSHPNTQIALEDPEVKCLSGSVSISVLIERLKSRRDGLAKLHEAALKTVQSIDLPLAPSNIPSLLQRLYCQAKLQYDTDVKEKAAFYIPLDVTTTPDSDARVPLENLWSTFLGVKVASRSSATTTAETSATSSTSSSTASTTSATLTPFSITPATEILAPDLTAKPTALLLLGASGSGKSLSTQLLVNQLWEAFLLNPQNPIPLRVELKQFSERTVGQCIINTLLDEYRYSPAELRQLQNYRFIFILDGYDEMANQAKVNLLTKHQATETHYGKWQAQLVISCRDSYFQGLDQSLFYPPQGIAGLEIRYLSVLTPSHQMDYLMRYKASVEKIDLQKKLPDYATLLTENPTLHELLGNPFLLRIFRDALPRWQQDHPNESLKNLTRYALYTAFMDQWFSSEALRLSMMKAKYLPDNLTGKFLDFSLRLAFEMHIQKVDEVNAKAADQETWQRFFSDQQEAVSEARAGCPLRRMGESRYSFVHKSFLEYFVARTLWQALENNDLTLWNQRLLPEAWEILAFLVEQWKQNPNQGLQDRLWDWIQGSKTTDQQNIASTNAITLLNHGGLSFIGEYGDLVGVKIPGADLQGGLFDHTCFRGANLRGVNLSRAFLRGTDFTKADLTDARFGEFPSLQFEDRVNCVDYSKDGKFLAMGVGSRVEVWRGDGSEKITSFDQRQGDVTFVAFDPTGTHIISGGQEECDLVLMSELEEGKTPEDNTLYLTIETEKQALFYKVKNFDKKFEINAADANNDDKFISRLVVAIDRDELNELDNEDREMLLSITSKRGHTRWDNTLLLWEAKSGKLLATLQGHTDYVTSCAFDPTGIRIVSGSVDRTLRLWEAESGKSLAILQGHTDEVISCAFDPTGTRIVSGGGYKDKTLRLWEAESGKLLSTLQGHTGDVRSCMFDPTGTRIVSGGGYKDETLRLWETDSGKLLTILQGHTSTVTSCAFDPTGTRIVSGSYDGSLRLWETESGKPLTILQGHTDYVISCAFDTTGTRVVSGSVDKTLRFWEVESGKPLTILQGHTDEVISCAFDPTGMRIVSGDGTLRLWEADNGKPLATLGYTRFVTSCVFDPMGTRIVSGSVDGTLQLWEVKSGKLLTTLQGHTDGWVSCVALSGTRIVSGSLDGTLQLWEAKSGKPLTTLQGHTGWVQCVAFDPTGMRIVSGGNDHTLRLWEAESGKLLSTLQGHTGDVTSCAFDSTGMRIVSGSYDGTLRLWEMESGKHLTTLQDTSHVTSCAFDPTGMRIVSGSMDYTLRLWEAESGKPLAILQGHTNKVTSCAFDTTGTRIVSGSWDHSILVWRSLNLDGTLWQVIWRGAQNPILTAPDAFLDQATLSSLNQNLLIQRGAALTAPELNFYKVSLRYQVIDGLPKS